MSIDLNWDTLAAGPDGLALEEKIRDLIHEKFQQVALPRFMTEVSVHAFKFGSIAPEIELKDICDPLPDFYEDEEELDSSGGEQQELEEVTEWSPSGQPNVNDHLHDDKNSDQEEKKPYKPSSLATHQTQTDARQLSSRVTVFPPEHGTPFYSGTGTPGIPGGTSNLHYFHSQLATGLSGTQTPLAAVAGAHLPYGWPDYSNQPSPGGNSLFPELRPPVLREKASVSTLAPSTSATRPQTREGPPEDERWKDGPPSDPQPMEPAPEDVQIIFRVNYCGDVRLSLTAEILLDYPMPSFVGIPVQLNITGLSFDGVGVLAHIRNKAHFCFLSPEDALASIEPERPGELGTTDKRKVGSLLRDIKVESEIGLRENGKQVLKNVGKVEKFVLEQVRRIFEDEFVYPSFWTFLI